MNYQIEFTKRKIDLRALPSLRAIFAGLVALSEEFRMVVSTKKKKGTVVWRSPTTLNPLVRRAKSPVEWPDHSLISNDPTIKPSTLDQDVAMLVSNQWTPCEPKDLKPRQDPGGLCEVVEDGGSEKRVVVQEERLQPHLSTFGQKLHRVISESRVM